MDETQKMLKIMINGQSSFRQEVLDRIDKVEARLEGKIDKLEIKVDKVEKNLCDRIDKIGTQLAYLEDDAPTREEFDQLTARVDKSERQNSPTV